MTTYRIRQDGHTFLVESQRSCLGFKYWGCCFWSYGPDMEGYPLTFASEQEAKNRLHKAVEREKSASNCVVWQGEL